MHFKLILIEEKKFQTFRYNFHNYAYEFPPKQTIRNIYDVLSGFMVLHRGFLFYLVS